jgi:hypothetical protein
MTLRYWQQVLTADPTALEDFLGWAEEERQRVTQVGFHAPSWDALLTERGALKMLDLLVSSFTLASVEEAQRAEYRRRNA